MKYHQWELDCAGAGLLLPLIHFCNSTWTSPEVAFSHPLNFCENHCCQQLNWISIMWLFYSLQLMTFHEEVKSHQTPGPRDCVCVYVCSNVVVVVVVIKLYLYFCSSMQLKSYLTTLHVHLWHHYPWIYHHHFHCPVSYCSMQERRRKAWSILKLGIRRVLMIILEPFFAESVLGL